MNTAIAGLFTGTVDLMVERHNAAHPFDRFELHETGQMLTIMPPKHDEFIPRLVITNVARSLVRVAQISENRTIQEAVFFTRNIGGWIPIGFREFCSDYYRPLARLTPDGNEIDTQRMNGAEVCSAARYCDGYWLGSLRRQGFMKLSPVTINSAVTTIELPNVENFMLS